jgi:hypothetical protein
MFTRLAKSGLAKSGFAKRWIVQPRRIASGIDQAAPPAYSPAYSNDNLPGFRRPAGAGHRRPPIPVLACHWITRDGRLECRWQAEQSSDAPVGEPDENGAMGGTSGSSQRHAAIHKTVFEPSYQERCRTVRNNVGLKPIATAQPIDSICCVARASLADANWWRLPHPSFHLRTAFNNACGSDVTLV